MTPYEWVSSLSPFQAGVVASFFSGTVATGLGAVPVFLLRRLEPRVTNALISFAAGVMLAATFFSLLIPSIDYASAGLQSLRLGVLGVIGSLLLGGLMLWWLHQHVPHEHFTKGREGQHAVRVRRVWLFVIAITIHNFPEGLAVGIGAASGDAALAGGVTLGIALQNMPEGLAVAVALMSEGYRRSEAFTVAFISGLVEMLGGVLGAAAIALSYALLPWALAFAAGAMLFVISSEIIPETHRPGMERGATAALFSGFCIMLFLDTAVR
jgi:zinc transporter, ZIP family